MAGKKTLPGTLPFYSGFRGLSSYKKCFWAPYLGRSVVCPEEVSAAAAAVAAASSRNRCPGGGGGGDSLSVAKVALDGVGLWGTPRQSDPKNACIWLAI